MDEKLVEEVKEVKRKMDLMARAIASNDAFMENEEKLLEAVRAKMPYLSVQVIGRKGIRFSFLLSARDTCMVKHMWGGVSGRPFGTGAVAFFPAG